jgi:GNAT superfamily N-acetyltransferase
VWSITCFVVDKPLRRDGIAAVLLDAAVEYAFRHNASSIEAYPHVSDGKDYMGGLELYLRAGFATIRDANKRAIVRRGR